jgi:hypothetical protein
MPQDYQSGLGDLAQTAIGQDRLQDCLANRIKGRRAIILLDTLGDTRAPASTRRPPRPPSGGCTRRQAGPCLLLPQPASSPMRA